MGAINGILMGVYAVVYYRGIWHNQHGNSTSTTCAPSISCGIYCNITSYDYMYRESCKLPLSSITRAFGPTNMATAPAPPVHQAFPVAYTAISPAMTTCIENLVSYLCLVLLRHLVQPTWQKNQHNLFNEHYLLHILQYHQL